MHFCQQFNLCETLLSLIPTYPHHFSSTAFHPQPHFCPNLKCSCTSKTKEAMNSVIEVRTNVWRRAAPFKHVLCQLRSKKGTIPGCTNNLNFLQLTYTHDITKEALCFYFHNSTGSKFQPVFNLPVLEILAQQWKSQR